MAKKPASSLSSSSTATPSSKPQSSSSSTTNPTTTTTSSSTTTTTTSKQPPSSSSQLTSTSSPTEIAIHIWHTYLQSTPARTFLLDAFMAFLVVIGGLQFLYAVLFGNYPFNAFLSGFSAAVGQFVLTASLRLQTSERLPASAGPEGRKPAGAGPARKGDGVTAEERDRERESGGVSSERAFADYVFGSLILHGFCVNFIN